MSESLDQLTENLITFMECSKYRSMSGSFGKLKPKWFDGAEPFLPSSASVTHKGYEDDYLIFMDARPSDLPTRLDVAMITPNEDDSGGFAASRFRQVELKEVRGRLRRPMPYVVDMGFATITHDGEGHTGRSLFGTANAERFVCLSNDQTPNAYKDQYWTTRIKGAMGVAWTRQFFWSVKIGYEGSPMIRIPTDPIGAREAFRLRDIPEGKQRRAAIRHWVSEHWRKRRDDHAEEVKVREHLRAATTFTWNGLRCEIHPSDDDMHRANRAIEQRQMDREAGTDRRVAS